MVVLIVLHRTAGFRTTRDVHLADAAADSAVSLALGMVLAAAVLVLLREIDMSTPVSIAVNKAAYQAIPFALGAGVARYVLTGSRDDAEQDDERRNRRRRGPAMTVRSRPRSLTSVRRPSERC